MGEPGRWKGVGGVGEVEGVGVLRLRSSRSAASYFAQDDGVWVGLEESWSGVGEKGVEGMGVSLAGLGEGEAFYAQVGVVDGGVGGEGGAAVV